MFELTCKITTTTTSRPNRFLSQLCIFCCRVTGAADCICHESTSVRSNCSPPTHQPQHSCQFHRRLHTDGRHRPGTDHRDGTVCCRGLLRGPDTHQSGVPRRRVGSPDDQRLPEVSVPRSAHGRGAQFPQQPDADEEIVGCDGDLQTKQTSLSLVGRRGLASGDPRSAGTHRGTARYCSLCKEMTSRPPSWKYDVISEYRDRQYNTIQYNNGIYRALFTKRPGALTQLAVINRRIYIILCID